MRRAREVVDYLTLKKEPRRTPFVTCSACWGTQIAAIIMSLLFYAVGASGSVKRLRLRVIAQ